MNLPPLRNPWSRVRGWVAENRVKTQILAIAALSIGLIVVMFIVTLVVIFRTLR